MTLLEIMERVGSQEPEKIKVFIEDALYEVADLIPERTTGSMYNITANQRYYTLPSNMVALKGVFRRWGNTTDSTRRYIRISRVQVVPIEEPTTGTTSVGSSTDIVVI